MPQPSQAESQQDARLKNVKSRDLRSKLRSFNEAIRNDGEDLADHRNGLLNDRLGKLNTLSKQVERPSEQADDSEAFYTLAQRGAEMAKRVVAGKGRSASDFIRHLKALYIDNLGTDADAAIQPDAFNWKRLSRNVSVYFKHVPGASCMHGPMDAVVKARKKIERVQRKPVGKAVAPKILEVEDAEAQEKRETERNMETMWNTLKTHTDGVGILELTMNFHSFAQFAENNFTLSFLVSNKRARITESADNNARGLVVFPYFPHSEKAAHKDGKSAADGAERQQFIWGLSVSEWENLKRYVREENCLMPHRAPRHQEEATGSGGARRGRRTAADVENGSEDEGEGSDSEQAEAAASPPQVEPSTAARKRGQAERRGAPSGARRGKADASGRDSDQEILVRPSEQHRKRLRRSGQ